jgi:predicted Zn finger-like uncharacterized protein
MYTQCPDCEIAFKVTAEVLKQAAGKVRCGGCGHAFNALAFLSEQMPKQPIAAAADAAVPELTPEIIDTDSGLPHSISAEQSAALLKTLDELAGSDIRIEDTGVEWRVLDESEATAPAADDDNADINVNELRFDDNTPLPDDFELARESSCFAEPVTAVDDDEADDEVEDPQPEIALSEPDEWADILGEFQELAEEVAAPLDIEPDAVEEDDDESADETVDDPAVDLSSADQPLDMDTQFALQAEAMGIDLSGINELEEDESEFDDELFEDESEQKNDALELATEVEGVDVEDEPEFEDEALEEEPQLEDDAFEDDIDVEDIDAEDEPEPDDAIAQLDLIDDQDELQGLIDEPIVESHTIEDELASVGKSTDDEDDASKHFVPPMTEEEHTVNMQIDQDLMALAFEDEDGFASTIVIPKKDTKKKAYEGTHDTPDDDGRDEAEASDDEAGFETIIMEGESIRSMLDDDKFAVDAAAAAKLADQARAKDAEQAKPSARLRYGIIAGIVLLVLLLAVQLMHQSRETLAMIPAFSNSVGKIYRAIGQPVQPAWDITGWRFEAAKDVTDIETNAGELVVYSRLGNNSDGPLPYPLIGISLTDRFEETIGSRMLDPAEYLPTDLDPRKLVEPGNTFNAVITIKSASENATGFKLNVCYRLSNGQLRCAIADFK